MTTDNSTTGADAPTKPIFELTDSELEQEFLKLLEGMSPEEFKKAKDFIWEFGSKLISEKEVDDE